MFVLLSDSTHVVAYVSGSKGAPGFCKLFQFPNFDQSNVLAQKSFFQGDCKFYI